MKEQYSFSEKPLIQHRNFQVELKDLFKEEKLDLEKVNIGDVVAIVGDYDSFTIKIFLKLQKNLQKKH